jgi:hypothetical protein
MSLLGTELGVDIEVHALFTISLDLSHPDILSSNSSVSLDRFEITATGGDLSLSASAAIGVVSAQVVNGHAQLALGVNAHWVRNSERLGRHQ